MNMKLDLSISPVSTILSFYAFAHLLWRIRQNGGPDLIVTGLGSGGWKLGFKTLAIFILPAEPGRNLSL